MKVKSILFRGIEIEVYRYERGYGKWDFYYYPCFNGDFEGKGWEGFKQVCSYIRSVLWAQNILKEAVL